MVTQFVPRAFTPQPNAAILNAIRSGSSTDYRARVPLATDANMDVMLDSIMSFTARRNEFLDALVNRIGVMYAKGVSFSNPLAKFKRGFLSYGETIEEVQVGLVKAKLYDPTREYLEADIFGTERVDVQSSFHTVNRKNFYKVTINSIELRKAFLEENGLSGFIAQLMNAPTVSDNWDEYLLMASLFAKYEKRSGFFKVNVPDITGVDADSLAAKAFLRAVRTMTDTLPFVSERYNAAHMPVAADRDELELFITPEANASIDVEALAAAFNVGNTSVAIRQTIVRQEDIGIPNAQAVLTTRDFFVVADSVYESRSIQNPAGLTENFFLHRQQIISASRFVPAILFTTDAGTPIVITPTEITANGPIVVTDRTGATVPGTALPRADFYQVTAEPVVTPAGNPAPVELTLTGALSQFTKLSQNGTLFVGYDETATKLTITVHAIDNPEIADNTKSYTLTGDIVTLWPAPGSDAEDPDVPDPTPEP